MTPFHSRLAVTSFVLVLAELQLNACAGRTSSTADSLGGALASGGSAGGMKSAGSGGASAGGKMSFGSGGKVGSAGEPSAGAGAELIAGGVGSAAGASPLGDGGSSSSAGAAGEGGFGGADSMGGIGNAGGSFARGGSGAGGATPICGNGRVEPPEDCDDGDNITNPCAYGKTSCTVCDANCGKGKGHTAYCGDGVVNEPYEECDDRNTITEQCPYGVTCTVCDASCRVVPGAVSLCGDGVVDSANGEACDDRNTSNSDTCSTACKTCGYVGGIPLAQAISGYANSGIQFTALTNATLTQFGFNNQGKADTVSLTRLRDNQLLYSITLPAAGSTGKTTVAVEWSLQANTAYALSSADDANGLYSPAPTGAYPGIDASGIVRVDQLYKASTYKTEYWFTFTDLHACAR